MARKRPYKVPNIVLEESSNTEELDRIETIETLDDIATLQYSQVKMLNLLLKK